ncbi:Transmembrane protein [Parasponia andersonii]|uniref:Transmembrane protein n=1 Tax=Parasponia andersonii TaxID=3476 RepID=A0A2P5D6Q5_PARAD|nr:Transmembrane protein [Parasponia andersonii]
MAETRKIIRNSVFTFLQNYHHFSSTAALMAIPFSASVLLSQAILPSSSSSSSSSSLLFTIYSRIQALFAAAGFPTSSEFFAILNQKLAQTISSSILTLPFALTFFLISKSYVIELLRSPKSKPSLGSVFANFSRIFSTYLWNSVLILAANATAFALLFLAFNSLDSFGLGSPNSILLLSAAGAVLYSIVLANALVVCNLGLVSAGMERSGRGGGGYLAILRACVLIRGRTSTALSLALPLNLAMAAIEALFQYRIVRSLSSFSSSSNSSGVAVAMEAVLIFYLYSILVVLDTVVNCVFFKTCKSIEEDVVGRRRLFYGDDDDDDDDDENENYYVYATLRKLEQLP